VNKISQQEIQSYILQRIEELSHDWDYTEVIGPQSLLFTELGFESLDAVVLCTALQEHFHRHMPFAELFAQLGEERRDLSIGELSEFVHRHVGGGSDATAGHGNAEHRA
jgi:acyl carrier protein